MRLNSARIPGGAANLLASGSIGFAAGLLLTVVIHLSAGAETFAQQESSSDAKSHQTNATSPARIFGSDAGLVLNFIKPDKATDFEAVIAKLKTALQQSQKPERRRQAASWKVFRAVEPGGGGSVLYLFAIDPAVSQADYTVSTILAEAYPNEVQALYKQYADSYAIGQNFVNLKLVSHLGDAGTK